MLVLRSLLRIESRAVCLVLLTASFVWVVAIAVFLCLYPPVRVIHPDTLNFLNFFQIHYTATHNVFEWPGHFYAAMVNANTYDLHRGRIFNYLSLALEALVRGKLPFAHFAWLTWVLQIMNACLLWRWLLIYSKTLTHISGVKTDNWVALSMALALLLNQNMIYGSLVHFIYSKYIVVTFILLYQNLKSKPWRVAALVCATFSDEIGLFFFMYKAFVAVLKKSISRPSGLLSSMRSISLAVVAAFGIFIFYHGFIFALFGEIPQLMTHQPAYGIDRGAILAYWRWLSHVASYTLSGFTVTSAATI